MAAVILLSWRHPFSGNAGQRLQGRLRPVTKMRPEPPRGLEHAVRAHVGSQHDTHQSAPVGRLFGVCVLCSGVVFHIFTYSRLHEFTRRSNWGAEQIQVKMGPTRFPPPAIAACVQGKSGSGLPCCVWARGLGRRSARRRGGGQPERRRHRWRHWRRGSGRRRLLKWASGRTHGNPNKSRFGEAAGPRPAGVGRARAAPPLMATTGARRGAAAAVNLGALARTYGNRTKPGFGRRLAPRAGVERQGLVWPVLGGLGGPLSGRRVGLAVGRRRQRAASGQRGRSAAAVHPGAWANTSRANIEPQEICTRRPRRRDFEKPSLGAHLHTVVRAAARTAAAAGRGGADTHVSAGR